MRLRKTRREKVNLFQNIPKIGFESSVPKNFVLHLFLLNDLTSGGESCLNYVHVTPKKSLCPFFSPQTPYPIPHTPDPRPQTISLPKTTKPFTGAARAYPRLKTPNSKVRYGWQIPTINPTNDVDERSF